MADSTDQIEVRQIEPGDRLTGLSLGSEYTSLKIFLQKHAKSYHEQDMAKTYAAFDLSKNGKIIGYISILCGEVNLHNGEHILPGDEIDYQYEHFPAVKIARLAVDARVRKTGLGRYLVDLALGVAKGTICPAVGCRFVVVDAKQQAIDFYVKSGFTMIDTEANRERSAPVMFVDLRKVPA